MIGFLAAKYASTVVLGAAACLVALNTASSTTSGELLRSCQEIVSRVRPQRGGEVDIPQSGLTCWYYMREVVNGLMYVLSTGCQWRAIPKDLPPKSTVYDYFDLWTYDGTLQRIHHALYEQCREQAQREPSPTAAIIDSQSVKSAEKGGPASMRRVTTPARKSRARSGMFSSIH